jgi:hypothetical protein
MMPNLLVARRRYRRFIQKALSLGKLKDLRSQPNSKPITHLQFVDENHLMGLPTTREPKAIKKTARNLQRGAKNLDKLNKISNLFF